VPATNGDANRSAEPAGEAGQISLVVALCWDTDVATVDDVRRIAGTLPRSYETVVRDRLKFKVGRIVYLAFSRDETVMGFAYPRDERDALVASDPQTFLPPDRVDERYHWVQVRLAALDEQHLRELVVDAWRMVVPKSVAAQHLQYYA
jgi:hypothetical protein